MLFVKLTRTFLVNGHADVDELDQHTDEVMEQLLLLESDTITDSDVSATLTTGEVSVSIAAAAESYDEALECADACIRSAIHAAGGHTPNWVTVETHSRQLVAA